MSRNFELGNLDLHREIGELTTKNMTLSRMLRRENEVVERLTAQHEADQKVIEAAKDALKKVRDWVTEDDGYSPELMIEREAEYQKKRPGAQFINTDYMAMLKALAEFDKVKP